MDNKELDEILQKYAESTRNDAEIAFKKLNEKPIEEKRVNKKFKWKYALVAAMSAIVIVLCIALPITLNDNSPQDNSPTYCLIVNIVYNVEESISVLKNKYGVNAHYPTCETAPEFMAYFSISLLNDEAFKGAQIGITIFEEDIINMQVAIVPKTYILQPFEDYFTLPNEGQWRDYAIKFKKQVNGNTGYYDMQIYFTDGRYDYFVSSNSDVELETTELLDILYC